MQPLRIGVYTIVAIIVVTSILSGPLVAGVDLTATERPSAAMGSGSVTLSVQSVPTADIRLQKGNYGSGAYYLTVPAATVQIEAVQGRPLLVYRVRIQELTSVSSSVTILDKQMTGRSRISFQRVTFQPDQIDRDRYHGTVQLLVRANDTQRVVFTDTISIQVTR